MYYTAGDLALFESITFNFIRVKEAGYVLIITLNRPEKRNAFTPVMVNEIAFALAWANTTSRIRCVLIEAEGPVFCAGMDLNVFQNPELDKANPALPNPLKPVNLGEALRLLDKPSVAKVQGPVLAGGFLITCGCLFVIATGSATFSLPEVKRGLFPLQVMASLSSLMNTKQALGLCILAETIDAEKAAGMNLVSHLSTDEKIDEDCDQLLSTIIAHAPFAIKKGLETFRLLPDLAENERFYFLAKQLESIRNSADAREGFAAFKEKRAPKWTDDQS